MSRPLVSIITVTHESFRSLQRLRATLKEHTSQPYEWLVVDNCSKGGKPTTELQDIERTKDGRVIYLDTNTWFTHGCNVGIDAASPDSAAIVLLNPDCAVTAGWLDALWSVTSNPKVGIVGAVLLNEAGLVVHAGGINMGDHLGQGETYDSLKPWAATRRHDDWVTGACLLITKAALTAVGGHLDEEFVHYFSDIKLCRDVRDAGYEVWMSRHTLTHSVGGSRQ